MGNIPKLRNRDDLGGEKKNTQSAVIANGGSDRTKSPRTAWSKFRTYSLKFSSNDLVSYRTSCSGQVSFPQNNYLT